MGKPQNNDGFLQRFKVSKWSKINKDQLKTLLLCRSSLIILSLIGVLAIILLIWKIPQQQAKDVTDPKERGTLENADRSTLIQAFGGLFLFVTAYFSLQNLKITQENLKVTQQNLIATQEKQVTERFAKAVEQLGHESIHVRMGAIYALERIAKDSDKDYWQVMEILTAYVRERSPYPPKEQNNKECTPENTNTSGTDNQKDILPITTDIQAVLTVITRRTKSYGNGSEKNHLDLSKSNLQEANLPQVDLCGANLAGANLSKAQFGGWYFDYYNVTVGADLSNANLSDANLSGANLYGADLKYANLSGADLSDADLWEAKHLIPERVKTAKNWEDAKYDKEFRIQLGLAPEPEEET